MSRITPPVPNTTLTPAYSTVSSSAGFQSGDLVYFRDSSFGTIPGNAVTSANFPINATVSQNQTAFNTTVNWANYNPTTRVGSTTSRAPSVALLTNGNIAVVFAESNVTNAAAACFKIIDQSGNVVVDRTPLGFNSIGMIGVCALSGGGFAIAALSTATGQVTYGVFSNAGAVVTAMASDSSFGNGPSTIEIRPLSGGGFVIGAYQGGTTFGFRVYSSVGVGGNYSSVAGWNTQSQIVITTFSDNTFAALYPTTNTTLSITRFNSTGGVVATYTATTDFQASAGYDFITLSTGVAVVLNIDIDSGNNRMFARTYDQSTGAVSSRSLIAGSFLFQQTVNACALSGGGFVALNTLPGNGLLQLRRYNASFGVLNTVDMIGLSGYFPSHTTNFAQRTTILEGATFLTLVDNSFSQSNYPYHSLPFMQIDKTNLTVSGIRRRFQATQAVTSLPAAVSGYARSNSTPNSAAFLASTTQTLSATIPRSNGSTFALTPYIAVSDTNITSQCMTDMTNGQFVISCRASTGSVRVSIFNPDGGLVSTIPVSSVSAGITRCTCLGNGKLVVSWAQTSTQINFAVFSAGSYTLLATGTTANIAGLPSISDAASWNSSSGHDIAPYGNDSFVLATTNSTAVTATIFNDSVVFQSFATGNGFGGIQNVRVASDATGDVAIKYYSTSQGVPFFDYFSRNTTTNSIFYYTSIGINSSSTQNFGEGIVMSPSGSVFGFAQSGITRTFVKGCPAANFTVSQGSMGFNGAGVCVGQSGEFVALRIDSGSSQWFRIAPMNALGPYGTSVGQTLAVDSDNMTISNPNTNTAVGSQAQIVNLYNDVYAFSYINGGNSSTGGQVLVGLLNLVAASYSSNITAGVTPSNTALVPSPANGYYLAGVSASECAAGGTGVLQINGVATLNSQYPAGTTSQAFDFNTPALDVGVRGTIAGRNVILSGGK